MKKITVNGIDYRERRIDRKEELRREFIRGYMTTIGASPYSKPAPKLDLIKEYALILSWKSNLSRSKREYVKREFNLKYEKI